MSHNGPALSARRNEWKAGWVPEPSAADPGILNGIARSQRLTIRHTVPDFSDSNKMVYRTPQMDCGRSTLHRKQLQNTGLQH